MIFKKIGLSPLGKSKQMKQQSTSFVEQDESLAAARNIPLHSRGMLC
ncbi:hypothetical protein P4H65_24340 [Paenibacillus chitinolyticus]|nr:hypothetical protein [Paenibacillus chitinolyticus]MEC0248924.1 hypothetical protein [Paenibacillus chitinolyticus]